MLRRDDRKRSPRLADGRAGHCSWRRERVQLSVCDAMRSGVFQLFVALRETRVFDAVEGGRRRTSLHKRDALLSSSRPSNVDRVRLTRQGVVGFVGGVALTAAVVGLGDDVTDMVLRDEDVRVCMPVAIRPDMLFPTADEAARAFVPRESAVERISMDDVRSLEQLRDSRVSGPTTVPPPLPDDHPLSSARYGAEVVFHIEPPEKGGEDTFYLAVQHRNVVETQEGSIPAMKIVEHGWGVVARQSVLECLA